MFAEPNNTTLLLHLIHTDHTLQGARTFSLGGDYLKVVWTQMYNSKLDSFAILHSTCLACMQPLLESKHRARLTKVCPCSLSHMIPLFYFVSFIQIILYKALELRARPPNQFSWVIGNGMGALGEDYIKSIKVGLLVVK